MSMSTDRLVAIASEAYTQFTLDSLSFCICALTLDLLFPFVSVRTPVPAPLIFSERGLKEELRGNSLSRATAAVIVRRGSTTSINRSSCGAQEERFIIVENW